MEDRRGKAAHQSPRELLIEISKHWCKQQLMKKVSFVVVGAGGRDNSYSNYVKHFPDEGYLAAVCEPREQLLIHQLRTRDLLTRHLIVFVAEKARREGTVTRM